MFLGGRDLKDLVLPTGWDGTYLARRMLQDGTTYEAVANNVIAASAAFNAAMAGHDWLGSITFMTQSQRVRYREGAFQPWQRHTEHSLADSVRGQLQGHMIPRTKFDQGLGWTWDYFNDADLEQIQADIESFTDTAEDMYEREAMQRLFKNEDELVDGSSGVAPGPVNGGTSSVPFTPITYQGQSFDATHNHALRLATADGTAVLTMVNHLAEHGHMAPFEMWVSHTDKATWMGINDTTNKIFFRVVPRDDFIYRTDETRGRDGIPPERYFGMFDTPEGAVYLRSFRRLPANYAAMFRPYGAGSQRNPLRWWGSARFGNGIAPLTGMEFGYPQMAIVGYAEYGFGYGADRTNAVLLYVNASGNYVTPTIP